jgi:hypothetical protein
MGGLNRTTAEQPVSKRLPKNARELSFFLSKVAKNVKNRAQLGGDWRDFDVFCRQLSAD